MGDFLGEFQTAAGEIVPHPEANAAPTDTDYLDSIIEEETNGDFNSGQRKLLAGITQLFNHAVRRFGEKAVENGVPAGVRVGANLAHISTTPFADLVRRRSRTVCQQEFVLELTLLISLLCQRTTVSCWVLEMRPLLLFTFHKPDDFLGEFQTE